MAYKMRVYHISYSELASKN